MNPPPSIPLDVLLAQVGWIRDLSRQLVRDPGLADEVVQATLVRASSEGPRHEGALRAWLAAMVRNFARAGLRAQARRRIHEQHAARPEGLPSVHEVVEHAAQQRELVECVLELEEPYRTTVLLRFYEAHSPREIASRMGVPSATVRTRLARGLALLRTRLDRRHGGDRARWALLLAPIRPPIAVPFAPLVAMKLQGTILAGVLCAAGLLWFLSIDRQPADPRDVATAGIAPATPELAEPAAADGPGEARMVADSTASAPPSTPSPTAPTVARRVRGKVLDVESRPVPDVPIDSITTLGGERTPIGRSDAEGGFELAPPERAARLEVVDERWCTVFAGLVGAQADQRTCTVVVAPNAPLSGMVLDDASVPLAGVEVRIAPQLHLRTRFADDLGASEDVRLRAVTDAGGRFRFERVPRCEGLRIEVELAGHLPFSATLLDSDRPFKTIVLTRASQADGMLRGRVVDEGDLPIAQAAVALGLATTLTDEQGEFAIDKQSGRRTRMAGDPVEVRALIPGKLPALYVPPMVDGEPQWPAFVTLKLAGKPLSLRGHAVAADGTPVAGARVWLADTTTFGEGSGGTLQLEGWLAGDTDNAWHYATTAADGAFELDGLLERDYIVCAIDPRTLQRARLEGVAAGSMHVVLEFPADALWTRIEGVAVDALGVPLADVRVVPRATTLLARHAGRNLFSTSMAVDGTTTDSEGRFVLRDVPREGIELAFSSDGVLTKEVALETAAFEAQDPPSLRVVLERRMHVQVELADPTSADAFALLDAEGKEISMALRTGTITYFLNRAPIVDGRSHVASGSERGRTVVTYKENREVARVPVKLSAEKITVVRM